MKKNSKIYSNALINDAYKARKQDPNLDFLNYKGLAKLADIPVHERVHTLKNMLKAFCVDYDTLNSIHFYDVITNNVINDKEWEEVRKRLNMSL